MRFFMLTIGAVFFFAFTCYGGMAIECMEVYAKIVGVSSDGVVSTGNEGTFKLTDADLISTAKSFKNKYAYIQYYGREDLKYCFSINSKPRISSSSAGGTSQIRGSAPSTLR